MPITSIRGAKHTCLVFSSSLQCAWGAVEGIDGDKGIAMYSHDERTGAHYYYDHIPEQIQQNSAPPKPVVSPHFLADNMCCCEIKNHHIFASARFDFRVMRCIPVIQ